VIEKMAFRPPPKKVVVKESVTSQGNFRAILLIIAGITILSTLVVFFPDEIPDSSRGLLQKAVGAVLCTGFASSIPLLVRFARIIQRYHLTFWQAIGVMIGLIAFDGILLGYALTHLSSAFAPGLGVAAISGIFVGLLVILFDRQK
jgi:hypothetical protein